MQEKLFTGVTASPDRAEQKDPCGMKDMSTNLIERYLTELSDIRATRAHVPETSFYPALEGLLNDVGKTLSPKVRCVINLQNRGAGLPDGGLFTADQFRRRTAGQEDDANSFLRELPARGVIEAKPPAENVRSVAETEQVGRYWKRYGVVLVTNFRAFALVAKDVSRRPVILESFSLGESEGDFWRMAAHPRKTGAEQGARMVEYLRRVLLHNALLASYARDAMVRVERADLPALATIRQALEEALGLRFEGEKGAHFFRSTLIQTLFYGVFSAWVL
jgi:hypothetical protein